MMSRTRDWVLTASMAASGWFECSCGGVARRGVDGLDVELDVDAVADQHAAGLEQLVPRQAEVLAVDRCLRDEPDPLVAPRIDAAAGRLGVERDLAGRVADRELADHAQPAAADVLHARAAEAQLGEPLDVEEVRRAQVVVALGRAG